MPNDAKLGLIAGIVLLLAVAVFFTRKQTPPTSPQARLPRSSTPATGVSRSGPVPQAAPAVKRE